MAKTFGFASKTLGFWAGHAQKDIILPKRHSLRTSYLHCAILVTSKSYPQAHMALTRGYGSYPQVIHRPPIYKFSTFNPYQRLLGPALIILYRELSRFSTHTAAFSSLVRSSLLLSLVSRVCFSGGFHNRYRRLLRHAVTKALARSGPSDILHDIALGNGQTSTFGPYPSLCLSLSV